MSRMAFITGESHLLQGTVATEAVGTVVGGTVQLADGRVLVADEDLVRLLDLILSGGLANRRAQVAVASEFVTPEEAAQMLDVSRPTIYKWQDAGVLGVHLVGTHRRVPREDVEALVAARLTRAHVAVTLDDKSLNEPLTDAAFRDAMFAARREGGAAAVAQLRRAQDAALARRAEKRVRRSA